MMPCEYDSNDSMSIRHDLAMVIAQDMRLQPMLERFLHVSKDRLGLSAASFYLCLDAEGRLSVIQNDDVTQLTLFVRAATKDHAPNHENTKVISLQLQSLLSQQQFFSTFERDDTTFTVINLSPLGCIVFEKTQTPLAPQLIEALQPIMQHLASAGIVCNEYERSLLEVERRKQAEDAYCKTEGRLRSILDNVVDGIITINEEGRIFSFNVAAERMFGYTSTEALELNVSDLMPDAVNNDEDVYIHLYKFEGEEQFRGFGREVMGRRKDGSRFPMDWAISEIQLGDERLFTGIARDITERRKVEDSLREQLRYANATSKLAEVLISENQPQSILDKTASIVGDALSVNRVMILKAHYLADEITLLSEWMNPYTSYDIHSVAKKFPLMRMENTVDALLSKEQAWVESHVDNVSPLLIDDNIETYVHDTMHIMSLLYYPFLFSEQGFYILAFDQVDYRRYWREEDISFISIVAQHVGVAMNKVALLVEREKNEQDLKLAATAFETREAILITNRQGIIQRVNKAFTKITGYRSDEVIGETPKILSSGRQSSLFYQKMWAELNKVGFWQGEVWNQKKNGDIFAEWQTITAVKDDSGEITHFVAMFSDITESKQSESRIRHLAYYDELTNLPNRSLLKERLNHEIAVAKRRGLIGALLFIDLDQFKTINDSLGHPSGDLILQEVAKRLQSQVRGEDTVARLGGDEFVLLLPGIASDITKAAHAVQIVGDKVKQKISQAYVLDSHEYFITPSIGVVMFPEGQEDVNDILKHADTAMYRAKAAGRNAISFYLPSMQEAADERFNLEKDLRHAVGRGELQLYYQPLVNNQGEIIAAEALVRWKHSLRGVVTPDQFIPLAEETGQILTIGLWVLRAAVAQMKAWRDNGLADNLLCVSVNVSPRQFHEIGFVQQVISVLEETGVPPNCLKLEITESMLMADVRDAIDKMTTLKTVGVRFAIDDFGTGFSSMAYLKRLPLDQLKIDKSFVQDIATDPNDTAIAETIILMARSLELDVVAEGVETQTEYDFLASKGCSTYQGYLFSRPVPVNEFNNLLKAQKQGKRLHFLVNDSPALRSS